MSAMCFAEVRGCSQYLSATLFFNLNNRKKAALQSSNQCSVGEIQVKSGLEFREQRECEIVLK